MNPNTIALLLILALLLVGVPVVNRCKNRRSNDKRNPSTCAA